MTDDPFSQHTELDVEGVPLDSQKGKAKTETVHKTRPPAKREGAGVQPPPSRSAGECRRWMHHRKGVYCKTCGRTP